MSGKEHEMDLKSCDPGCRSHKKEEVTHGITLHATTSLHGNVERRNFFTIGVLSHQRPKERDDRVTGGHNNCCVCSKAPSQIRSLIAAECSLLFAPSFCFIYAASSFCHVPYFCLLFCFFDVGRMQADRHLSSLLRHSLSLLAPAICDLAGHHLPQSMARTLCSAQIRSSS